jgi:hypothetical protein
MGQVDRQVRQLVEALSASGQDLTNQDAADVLAAVGDLGAAVHGLLTRMADQAGRDAGQQALVVQDLKQAAAAASKLTGLVAAARGSLVDD